MKTILAVTLIGALALDACNSNTDAEAAIEAPVRGLLTTEVKRSTATVQRRYPGVLEPSEITPLSFKVAGKLGVLSLAVGQRVSQGDLLAALDSEQFETTIENRVASVEEATAQLEQNEEDLTRQQTLFERGAVTKVSVDQADTAVKTARAQVTQAEKALKSAEEDLADAKLFAPFDGIINSVDSESFATVASGTTIASLYIASDYEVAFSVNFDTVRQLVVGTPARIRLADDPTVTLQAVVSELGERADTVSSFPVVVRLEEENPLIRAGMAVEVSFDFELPAEQGFLIPMSAAITDGTIEETSGPNEPQTVPMFVFDAATSTVQRRETTMVGLRENQLLIIDGLSEGEHVAVAGVSFLREGMQVKLLETED